MVHDDKRTNGLFDVYCPQDINRTIGVTPPSFTAEDYHHLTTVEQNATVGIVISYGLSR